MTTTTKPRTKVIAALCGGPALAVENLVAPLFVMDGSGAPMDVPSMPGVQRRNLDDTLRECEALAALGIRAVALFPVVAGEHKDATGSYALREDGLFPRILRAVKAALPQLTLIADVALDPYTTHGHDGLLDARGGVDNDPTVARLADLALLLARAGADIVAPSDMMDGRVRALRAALDGAAFGDIAILSYAAKFASAFYGPFRDAVGSAQAAYLDKRTYQLDPANAREAVRDALLDEAEGADALMVKPAGPYLDILARLRARTALPLAAYQVSGEYAQLHAGARAGWLDLDLARDESLTAIRRAGADFILTYFARAAAAAWRERAAA